MTVCQLWAQADDLPDSITAGVDPVVVQALLQVASDQLYHLAGARWPGACTRTVTITADCHGPEQAIIRRNSGPAAAVPWSSMLQLPDWPVTAITSLKDQSGTTIPGDRWRLVNGRAVEALSGGVAAGWSWPEITVSYEYGQAPPEGGHQAAITLTTELILSRSGSSNCRLPERVQSITRQGISMAVLDSLDFLQQGGTGIVEIDAWLASVNPAKARARPMVWSPDTNRTRVRSHPGG